jgi:hypothetical protein
MTHDPSGPLAASAVMRPPARGLGSRTSDRFRTETARPVTVAWARCLLPKAGLAFLPPRVSSPVLSTPAGKLASAAVRPWLLRRFRFSFWLSTAKGPTDKAKTG